jgi:alanine-synthesizing transaminase
VHFSARTAWPRSENLLSVQLARLRAAGAPLVDLTTSNPTTADLPYDGPSILAAWASPEALGYAPEALGLASARAAVAAYYARRGLVVSPERVLLTASTSEAYTHLLRLLCDAGDHVLVPTPSYPLFDFLLDLADVARTPYRLAWDGAWYLDRDSVRRALTPRTRAILVVSPNNPTGTVLGADDRAWLCALAAERGLALISDEVFADYAASHRAASWIGEPVLTFSLNGLSKVAGLPQLKLGWVVLGGPPAQVDEARARLELVADTFLSVSTPVMVALPTLLAGADAWQRHLVRRLADNRRALVELTRGTALAVRPSDGGWSAIVDGPRLDSDEATSLRLLTEAHVVVHPGYLFDLEQAGCLVLSLLPPPAVFSEGVRRIVSALGAC